MRVIKHIWRYLTDKKYRYKMTLLGNYVKRFGEEQDIRRTD